jgi:diguanylate cyclase (GGDEF)-like protein
MMDHQVDFDPNMELRLLAERELARPQRKLLFSQEVEDLFNSQSLAERARHLRLVTVLGLITLNVNLYLDSIVMCDIFRRIVVDQLLVVTPILLTTAWLWFKPEIQRSRQDRAVLFNCLVLTLTVLLNVFWSHTEFAAQNFFLVDMAVFICLLVCPMPFRLGCTYAAAILLVTAVLVFQRADLPPIQKSYILQYMVLMEAASLFAVYGMEARARRLFLLDLIQKALIDDLSAERRVLSEMSTTDPLTGTANRRRLGMAMARLTRRQEQNWGLLLIDVDRFKKFNDRHGHVAGDQCLREVAGAIQAQLRVDIDLLARFGGEEFAVLLPDHATHALLAMAERIRTAIEAHIFTLNGSLLSVTASIGAASAQLTAPEQIIEEADRALYAAKRAGRNRVRATWLMQPQTMLNRKARTSLPRVMTGRAFTQRLRRENFPRIRTAPSRSDW